MRSNQAKLYIGVHGLTIALGALSAAHLSTVVPKDSTNKKIRFWSKYVQVVTMNIVLAAVCTIAVDALVTRGYSTLSWLMAILPLTYVWYSSYVLFGVDTLLENTSGNNSTSLIKNALKKNK